MRNLLAEINAISIPEKKAENSNVISMMSMGPASILNFDFRDCKYKNILIKHYFMLIHKHHFIVKSFKTY